MPPHQVQCTYNIPFYDGATRMFYSFAFAVHYQLTLFYFRRYDSGGMACFSLPASVVPLLQYSSRTKTMYLK